MNAGKILTPYIDLKDHAAGKSGFFFLEHILRARLDLHLETSERTCDQELNVYIAGLLNSLCYSGMQIEQKPYLSPFDNDIQCYLSTHPGPRNMYTVYRENADAGLLFSSLFSGWTHKGSYHHRVMSKNDESGRIAFYYECAAHALAHLQGQNIPLIDVLETLSSRISDILRIISYAATYYFDMLERISEGSMFHLGKDLDKMHERQRYENKLDDFLKEYTQYTAGPTNEGKEKLMILAQELRKMKESFRCDLF